MAEPTLLVEDKGPVRWLVLNRPEARNAMDKATLDALLDALESAKDAPVRCLAVTGAGDVFSAGADLRELRALMDASYTQNIKDSRRIAALFRAIQEHPLPVVAAVNGPAIGGGAGLAAACDLAVAAQESLFAFAEVRIGFVPAIVLNFLLPTLGEKAARELCLTGRRIPAEEAKAMGLVNEVVDRSRLRARVAEIGAEIALAGPHAVAKTKALFLKLRAPALFSALDVAAEENALARSDPECKEGVSAFLERRKPTWISAPREERG